MPDAKHAHPAEGPAARRAAEGTDEDVPQGLLEEPLVYRVFPTPRRDFEGGRYYYGFIPG